MPKNYIIINTTIINKFNLVLNSIHSLILCFELHLDFVYLIHVSIINYSSNTTNNDNYSSLWSFIDRH